MYAAKGKCVGRKSKRFADILVCLAGAPFILPLCLLLALLICLDGGGSPFYAQERLGLGGRKFRLFKFRTMVVDADAALRDYLRENPDLAREWRRDWKLKKDPRVTRLGNWLRKSGLDELPQIFNVLKGEMSLVGPRPIVAAEKEKYGRSFSLYCQARPGISGLWQVSGRNDTTYARRVACDRYYVKNWRPSLDLWILLKTFPAALSGRGAY